MFFQLSLPASLPTPEAPHTMESLTIGAPATLTVEVLTREQRAVMDQRAHCRLGRAAAQAAGSRTSITAAIGAAITFTP